MDETAARQKDKEILAQQLGRKMEEMFKAYTVPSPARAQYQDGVIHTVEAGQTLSEIAARYGVTIRAIMQANKLSNPDQLHVGQELFIPD